MFYDMLTAAIKMGMSPDDFWHGEPTLYYNYLEAYESKQEEERVKADVQAWLQGLYIVKAIAVNNPLAKEETNYYSEPLSVQEKRKKEEAAENKMSDEKKEEFEMNLAIAQFKEFGKYATLYNQQYFGEEEGQ